jgi:hypothetical protein
MRRELLRLIASVCGFVVLLAFSVRPQEAVAAESARFECVAWVCVSSCGFCGGFCGALSGCQFADCGEDLPGGSCSGGQPNLCSCEAET